MYPASLLVVARVTYEQRAELPGAAVYRCPVFYRFYQHLPACEVRVFVLCRCWYCMPTFLICCACSTPPLDPSPFPMPPTSTSLLHLGEIHVDQYLGKVSVAQYVGEVSSFHLSTVPCRSLHIQ